MKKRVCISSVVLLLLLAGCQTIALRTKPPLEEEGELFLYMNPFPQGGERIAFALSGIFAVRDDDRRFPLSVARAEIASDTMKRQRLLASGLLPPGRYAGLAFGVKSAALRGEEGYSNLLTADASVRNFFPFEIRRKKAVMIAITFRPSDSVGEGFRFTPAFTLEVPSRPLLALTGYVSNEGDNTVTVFDKQSGLVRGMIATGKEPTGMALDQFRRQAYVALSGEDAIAVIDMTAGEVVNRIDLHARDAPKEIALSPDGRTLLAVNSGSNTVSFIDPLFLNETSRITVGTNPVTVTMDRAGQRAYVFNSFSNSLSVIDIPNRAVTATVAVEPAPLRGEFNRSGDRLYVAHEWSPYLTVLDTASLTVVKRMFVGAGISCMKLDSRQDMLYVAKRNTSLVEGYDPFSLLPVDYIRVGGDVAQIAIDREGGNYIFVVPEHGGVAAVNPAGKNTVFDIDTGTNPYRVTFMGDQ